MTTRVLGVDPSLSATGLALPDGNFRTFSPRKGPDDIAGRLHEIYCDIAGMAQALVRMDAIDVVVMETVSLHGRGGSLVTVRLAQLSGVLLLAFYECALDVIEINSSTLKKYATGNGMAQKPVVVKAAKEKGARVANDNEADAFWLKKMGDDFYNMTPAESQSMLEPHQLEISEKVEWPRL